MIENTPSTIFVSEFPRKTTQKTYSFHISWSLCQFYTFAFCNKQIRRFFFQKVGELVFSPSWRAYSNNGMLGSIGMTSIRFVVVATSGWGIFSSKGPHPPNMKSTSNQDMAGLRWPWGTMGWAKSSYFEWMQLQETSKKTWIRRFWWFDIGIYEWYPKTYPPKAQDNFSMTLFLKSLTFFSENSCPPFWKKTLQVTNNKKNKGKYKVFQIIWIIYSHHFSVFFLEVLDVIS